MLVLGHLINRAIGILATMMQLNRPTVPVAGSAASSIRSVDDAVIGARRQLLPFNRVQPVGIDQSEWVIVRIDVVV